MAEGIDDVLRQERTKLELRDGEQPDALCFSGGGIRSGSFNLGVSQALAEAGLLKQFHYLSTVSGGGYIGGWLQTLIAEKGNRVADAEAELARGRGTESALGRLRRYTNFLTPDPSPTSIDTFAGIALYLRNMVLNWLLLLPLLLAITLPPILERTFVAQTHRSLIVMGLAALLGVWVTFQSAIGLPSHREPGRGRMTEADVRRWIVAPFLVWALLMTAGVVAEPGCGWPSPGDVVTNQPSCVHRPSVLFLSPFSVPLLGDVPWVTLAHAGALLVGYLAAMVVLSAWGDKNIALFRKNAGSWCVATIVSAAAVWGAVWLSGWLGDLYLVVSPDSVIDSVVTIVFPFLLALAVGLHATIFLGLRADGGHFELDREWLARLSGMKLKHGFLWLALAFCTIGLPRLLLGSVEDLLAIRDYLLPATATTPLIAWLGQRAATRARSASEAKKEKSNALTAAALGKLALIAIALLIALMSVVMQKLILGPLDWLIKSTAKPGLNGLGCDWPWMESAIILAPGLVVLALFYGLFKGVGALVNANRFSLHAVYRNRLARAFLGSPRDQRDPDPFSNFDDKDGRPLAEIWTGREPKRLFPVVNLTLNLSTTRRPEWMERKAMSFTATPLHCGAAQLDHPGGRQHGPGAFIPTAYYAGKESPADADAKGMTLASAIAISGAAASPNWGYHSSPPVAFLMTLFNVRLGAWLPNPAIETNPEHLNRAFPRNGFRAMLSDLAGMSDENSQSVYLSDGGHFDNLGLYEMLRRRCRYMVVVDAGQDGSMTFEDLGHAIRKSEVDLGVRVRFRHLRRVGSAGADPTNPTPMSFAIGEVTYLDEPARQGTILYIKPVVSDDMPAGARLSQPEQGLPARDNGRPVLQREPVRELSRVGPPPSPAAGPGRG